jgi:hypothetical protein
MKFRRLILHDEAPTFLPIRCSYTRIHVTFFEMAKRHFKGAIPDKYRLNLGGKGDIERQAFKI